MVAAISAVGASTGINSDQITLALPAGLSGGEVLLAVLHNQNTGLTADASAAGWERVGPAFVSASSDVRLTAMYRRVHTPGDTDPTFFLAAGGRYLGFIIAVTGALSTPSSSSSYVTRGLSGNTLAIPAYTGSGLTLEVWAANFSAGQVSTFTGEPPLTSARVSRFGSTLDPDPEETGAGRSVLAVWSGRDSVAAHSITTTGNSSHAVAFSVTFPDADAGLVPMECRYSNGTAAVAAEWVISDGTELRSPTGVMQLNAGYASVDAMLATPGFTVAHRGGSRAFPEMSRFAYTQSALRGYRALEVSLGRTSDGVWFGLHDQYLDRVVLGAAGTTLEASALTWAQVQTHEVLGSICEDNPTTPPRPFQTLDQILADFGSDWVLFIDPKYAMDYADDLLDILDTVPGGTSRFVGKFFGVQGGMPEDSTSWALKCRTRGYKTWGYFYADSDFSYAARWDILGMDLGADQAAWDALATAAPGKPIIGHIAQSPTQVTTALSKGADGVMVAAATTVTPV